MKLAIKTSELTKKGTILSMTDWPLLAIALETKDQEKVLKEANQHYQGLSLWLQYYLLGRSDLHFLVMSEPLLQIKPYADLSVAGLNFCFQVYARYPASFDSAEELWSVCEYSRAKNEMTNTGYFGNKTKGKDAHYKANQKAIEAFDLVSQGGKVNRILDYDAPEHWYERLLSWALDYAKEHDDKDLDHHAHQYIRAWRHFNDITRRSGIELVRAKPEKPKRSRAKKTNVTKC